MDAHLVIPFPPTVRPVQAKAREGRLIIVDSLHLERPKTVGVGVWRGKGPCRGGRVGQCLPHLTRTGTRAQACAPPPQSLGPGLLLWACLLACNSPPPPTAAPLQAELSTVLDVLLPEGSRRSVLLSDLTKQGRDGGEALRRASGNLGWVDVVPSLGLNVYSILRRDYLVLTRASADAVQARLRTPIRPRFFKAL